jgi:hypothetical protein
MRTVSAGAFCADATPEPAVAIASATSMERRKRELKKEIVIGTTRNAMDARIQDESGRKRGEDCSSPRSTT